VLYCNRRFAQLIRLPRTRLIGSGFLSVVEGPERTGSLACLAEAQAPREGEFTLRAGRNLIPVHVSLTVSALSRRRWGWFHRSEANRSASRPPTWNWRGRRTGSSWNARSRPGGGTATDCPRIARRVRPAADRAPGRPACAGRRSEPGDAAALAQRLRAIAAQAIGEVGRLARGLHRRCWTTTAGCRTPPVRGRVRDDSQHRGEARA